MKAEAKLKEWVDAVFLWIEDRPWIRYIGILATILCVVAWTLVVAVPPKDKEFTPPPATVTSIVAYEVELDALKLRLSVTEENILAVAGAINKVSAALENIQPPQSLRNLATKGELDLLRLEVKALGQELTRITNIYGHYSEVFDLELEEMRLDIEGLQEELTAHTDNTTIHKQEGQ